MAAKTSRGGARTSSPVARVGNQPKRGYDRKRIIKLSIKLMLVLLAVFLLVLLWRNRVDWSFVNIAQCAKDTPALSGSGEGFPASVSGSHSVMIDELSGGVAVLSDSALTVFSKSSKEAVSRAHFMSAPVMKTAGRYALLIDVGNRSYRLETISDTLTFGNSDTSLRGGAVAHDGSFALVMAGESALSTVEVHKRDGELVHKWSTSLSYITDAALTADGRYLALCCVTAEGGKLKSIIIIHRVGVEGEVARYELSNELLLGLEFTNTGTLFAISSEAVMVISEYGEPMDTIETGGEIVAYDVSYGGGVAIYASMVEDNSRGELLVLDTRGHTRFSTELDIYGVAVSLSEDTCALLGRGTLSTYRLNGELFSNLTTGSACSDVVVLGAKVYTLEGMNVSVASTQ